jgi:chitinase
MGYYYAPASAAYPASAIDWSALTHVAVAFYEPQPDGSLDESLRLAGGAGPPLAQAIVGLAHAHGVKAIASIGGAASAPHFQAATAAAGLAKLVASAVGLMTTYGYDGVDVDWEPLAAADGATIVGLASQIRATRPDAILTIPVAAQGGKNPDVSTLAAISEAYDQVNITTYGMAGAYPGWKSWHAGALYATDPAAPSSVDGSVALYLAAGVPAKKLGFGVGFYGLCYTAPVTAPAQPLGGATVTSNGMTYAEIADTYLSPGARHWDTTARVPYLSFGAPTGSSHCTYVTYDDEQSIAEKAAYLKAHGLGGMIAWALHQGFSSGGNPLLHALRAGVLD